jgi:predicted DNA-binding protein with PD1-like motif
VEYFNTGEWGRTFILRLDRGDYVLESIMEFIEKEGIKDAAVVSGIGSLDECIIHMVTGTEIPYSEYFKRWSNQPLELASLSGLIINGQPHLHTVISDTESACAGHMEKGCRILCLGEIVIAELKTSNLARVFDAKAGVCKLTNNGA